ncbi:hypothetical protein [Arthrobacter livingstonensis]|uniref:hypothetical protein n=1 Tax=Arthrobacter livingstonensis TaxID=670078 RepID=UPI001FE81B2C|nr:hypothetical protein [Arthrobacter livingstonensis]
MSDGPQERQQLSARIEQRRSAVMAFLRKARPRRNRLTNISIVGSALAAVLTVGPAVGGTRFTGALQGIFSLGDDSIVWRVLCLAAVLLSLAAALSTSLANSHAVAAQVSAAEACNAELDGLEAALAFGQLPTDKAVELYRQYVAKVSFIDDAPQH